MAVPIVRGIAHDITERKLAEAALWETESQLHAVLNNAPITIFTTDSQGIFTLSEGKGLENVRLKPGENVGTSAFDLYGSFPFVEYSGKVTTGENVIRRVLAGEEVAAITELRSVYFDNHLGPLRGTDGKVVGIVGVAIDITERKQAEETLRNAEARYRVLFEQSPNGVLLIDPATGKTIEANETAHKQLGYTREEFAVLRISDYEVLEEPEETARRMQKIIREGSDNFETLHRTKSGEIRNVHVWAKTVQLSDRGLFYVIFQDITERKQVEEAFQNSRMQLEGIFNSTMDAIITMDEQQKIIIFNPSAEQMFRCLASEAIGQTLDRFLPEYVRKEHKEFVRTFGQSALTKRSMQTPSLALTCLRADGEVFPSEVSISRLEIGGQKLYTAIVRDITERKRAEEKIKRQLERLTALNEIDRMIASSFDLHLSLTSIVDRVISQQKVDAADILIMNPDLNILEFGAGQGFNTLGIEKGHLSLGEGYAGRAALERQTIHIADLRTRVDNPILRKTLVNDNFVSYYAVPFIAKGKVKGVLEVFNRSPLDPDFEWLDFLNTLAGQAAIAIDNATLFGNLQRSNLDLTLAYDATLEGWSHALDLRDKETEGHTRRVTEMAMKLARAFGLSEAELVQVRWGALLHDIGKMGIPDEILHKPSPLTDEEWVAMKKHPTFAYELLSPIRFLRLALDIPYCHHEKWDGTGYPRGLKGTQIPLVARIFAVIDVWDALTSDRVYRKAWSNEKALDYIRSQVGTHFDPQVVNICFELGVLERKNQK